ncbi:MAG: thiamine-phosphate kinase [Verrucomicrobia bacterium]|nr:thiamine-phosphate kinase [Verrucomicrobiota bacterium]
MSEFELIARIIPQLPRNESVVVGAGDDCAVLDFGIAGRLLLFKTDAVVEGIHFTKEAEPEKVGHKALARCLSDVAAMAGTPTHALVTLGLPRTFEVGFVDAIYRGLNRLAARHEVAVVGGETTTNPERSFISVSVLGTVPKEKCILRSGAKVGDAIFVTGTLGGSLEGKHLEFEPRLAEARWLAEHFEIHAMMDISDGLASDLRHLMRASGVGAELLSTAIPISRAARSSRRAAGDGSGLPAGGDGARKPPLLAALTDGEDFELLLTVAASQAVILLDAWKERFADLPLTCIGRIMAEPGLLIRDKEGTRPLLEHGYVHFA